MRTYLKKGRLLPCLPQTDHLFMPQTALGMESSTPGNKTNLFLEALVGALDLGVATTPQ
jgi:hypothetical protein